MTTSPSAERSSVLERLCARIEAHESTPETAPVTVRVEASEVRRWLASFDFARPLPLPELFDEVDGAFYRWTEHARHPMHLGLFRPNVDLAAVVADALVALYDPNLATWSFSPVACEIERHVLGVLARRFGYDADEAFAHFTSGGQEANHTAVAVAMTQRFPGAAAGGLRALAGQPTLYVSQEGHHSFQKVAHTTGLGRDALRDVPVGDDLRLDVAALAQRIARDRADGRLPFLVLATAGTTNAGIVDPLPELAELCAAEGLWLHVDAAWGGAAALSDSLRPHLAGIERADSITCDAHKWLSVPVGAGMFFTRQRAPVEATFVVDAAYAPPEGEGVVIPFITSMQWSRRFIGLKLFLTMASRGLAGMARRIEQQARVGEYLKRRLREEGWRVLNDTPLPVACFTHPELAGNMQRTRGLVREVTSRGDAWISSTVLRGSVPAVRACITNFDTNEEHIERLLAALATALERVQATLEEVG